MGYLDDVDPETFDRVDYLTSRVAPLLVTHPDLTPADLLKTPRGRRALTKYDPLAFALVYFSDHMASEDTGGQITISEFHKELFQEARRWEYPHGPQECRSAWVAPRGSGKSTLGYLLLPMWALAHGHRNFAMAFADSGPQSTQHLMSFKRALDTTDLLRADYPDLCTPAVRPGGVTVADRQDTYIAKSGAAFMARGADASTLGAKIENRRPDLLLLDDIEPSESVYSLYQKDKRLDTVTSAIFPMSLSAVVMFLGTTTMSGSIMHDLVRQVTEAGSDALPAWPQQERIDVHYFPAIITTTEGHEASLWPARWSLDFLRSIRGTRSYAKNYDNQPAGHDGGFWQTEDITIGTCDTLTRRLLIVDPAVTAKRSSDRTGIAVVAYSPTEKVCVVERAEGVQLTGKRLADHLLKLIAQYPQPIHRCLVETNQGGDLWPEVFEAFPIPVWTHHAKVSKEERFAKALEFYQKRPTRVLHSDRFPVLEAEMLGFPKAAHDDVADAVVAGILRFLDPPKKVRAGAASVGYV